MMEAVLNASNKTKVAMGAGALLLAFFLAPSDGAKTQNIAPTGVPTMVSEQPFSSPTEVPTITQRPTDIPPPTIQPSLIPTSVYIAPTAVYFAPTDAPEVNNNQQTSFGCNCSKTCTEMNCEEAYFQLNSCGCSQRDGDDDGIPCENVCGG